MISLTQWTWVWTSSRNWWWAGKPGVLQSMRSQRVGHNWATEQQHQCILGIQIEACLEIFGVSIFSEVQWSSFLWGPIRVAKRAQWGAAAQGGRFLSSPNSELRAITHPQASAGGPLATPHQPAGARLFINCFCAFCEFLLAPRPAPIFFGGGGDGKVVSEVEGRR